jgi:hypothetical protein
MPCVVTQLMSSSTSCRSSDSGRAFWRIGITKTPRPTTILNPWPLPPPSGSSCDLSPETISASFGSATL